MSRKEDTNKDGIVTLREFLAYEKDAVTDRILTPLSEKLELIHRHNYCVDHLNSDEIILEDNGSDDTSGGFGYANIVPMTDKEIEIPENIESFAKLAVGAKISTPSGFSDYTILPTPYIKSELANIITTLDVMGEDSSYFENLFGIGDKTIYYHNFIKDKQQGNGNSMGGISKTKVAANGSGKLYTPEPETAFINVLFYPLIIASIIIVFIILYNCVQFFI